MNWGTGWDRMGECLIYFMFMDGDSPLLTKEVSHVFTQISPLNVQIVLGH